jgi:glucosamine-6-phosphate deaminase
MAQWQPELASFIDFRDAAECARVRRIKKEDICKHPNPDFRIRVIESPEVFYGAFAADIVSRIVQAAEAGRKCVLILPVGPVPQYAIAADLINRLRIDCKHLMTFNMDEYADHNGQTAPPDWEGSFATTMWKNFFGRIDPELRPAPENIHFPSTDNIASYSDMIMEATDGKGADCCYGGIGWCGHIAFWESHLGHNYPNDEEWKKAKAQIVELHPMTIMQNALHSFGGDWSWVPPKAATIAPYDILHAQYRSFWLDGVCGPATTMSWQRFIARLVAHGPVTRFVPGSILQTVPTTYTILGVVAEDVRIEMA